MSIYRIRTVGSAALHMCLVAAGQVDAHFSQGIYVWDIAAGWLIVREAGGVVCDTGGAFSPIILSYFVPFFVTLHMFCIVC